MENASSCLARQDSMAVRLRAAAGPAHGDIESVPALVRLLAPDLTEREYVAVLRHVGAFYRALAARVGGQLSADAPARAFLDGARLQALADDFAFFGTGEAAPCPASALPELATDADRKEYPPPSRRPCRRCPAAARRTAASAHGSNPHRGRHRSGRLCPFARIRALLATSLASRSARPTLVSASARASATALATKIGQGQLRFLARGCQRGIADHLASLGLGTQRRQSHGARQQIGPADLGFRPR